MLVLLSAGIDVNSWDSEGSKNTPLHWAACFGNKEIVNCLLNRGGNFNAENGCGATPLHEAVNRGDVGICQELLQAGANPHIRALQGKFAGKSPYELSRNKSAICALMQLIIPNIIQKETTDSSISGYQDTNSFSKKSLSANMSQLSIDSNKSSDPLFEQVVRDDTTNNSPNRSLNDKSCIWNLIWPQPKSIIQFGNYSPPFIAGKELFISIIQVLLLFLHLFYSFFINIFVLNK